jgi:hypothetical protein
MVSGNHLFLELVATSNACHRDWILCSGDRGSGLGDLRTAVFSSDVLRRQETDWCVAAAVGKQGGDGGNQGTV